MDLSCPCYTFVDLCHRDFAKDPFTLWNGIFNFNRLTNKDYSFPKKKQKKKNYFDNVIQTKESVFSYLCIRLLSTYSQIFTNLTEN